jgi:hypothetical protein
MSSTASRSSMETVFDWVNARRRADLDALASRLAPDVQHVGIRPGMICRNRDEVVALARNFGPRLPQVDVLELVAAGDRVVLSIRGPEIGVPAVEDSDAPRGQATIVFTVRDGLITHMQDYLHRQDALDAVGAAPTWD